MPREWFIRWMNQIDADPPQPPQIEPPPNVPVLNVNEIQDLGIPPINWDAFNLNQGFVQAAPPPPPMPVDPQPNEEEGIKTYETRKRQVRAVLWTGRNTDEILRFAAGRDLVFPLEPGLRCPTFKATGLPVHYPLWFVRDEDWLGNYGFHTFDPNQFHILYQCPHKLIMVCENCGGDREINDYARLGVLRCEDCGSKRWREPREGEFGR